VDKRFWEIDAWRGLAIVSMVFYHFMWDLLFFGVVRDVALQSGGWKYFQRSIASSFIFLAGVSLVVSYQQVKVREAAKTGGAAKNKNLGKKGGSVGWQKFLRRGAKVFAWGLVMGIGVRVAGVGRIDFGVLHLIGFSIMASYPFLHFRWINIGLWALFNFIARFLQEPLVDHYWLTWLGFIPPNYSYLDFFPVFPWFGVALLGIGVGNLLYVDYLQEWRKWLPNLAALPPIRFLRFLGGRSLVIYLLHQPILFVLLYLWFAIAG